LRRGAVEDLNDGTSELLRTPEGTVGNIDVDGQRLLELVIKNRAKGGKDTLESLDTAAKIETLLAALEEGLLDLSVLLRGPLPQDVVEEVDRVNAVVVPADLTVEESSHTGEVDLTSTADEDGVLVSTHA